MSVHHAEATVTVNNGRNCCILPLLRWKNWDGAESQRWYTFIAFVVDFVVVRTYFTVSPGSCLS